MSDHKTVIQEAMEGLRLARNNMLREDFTSAVNQLCEDANLRYPLIEAGLIANDSHVEHLG